MYIICSKNDLINAVNTVSKAVSIRTTMPILECILLEAGQGQLILTGNNTDMGIQTLIEARVKKEGKIAINAKLFSEIIKKLPDDDVYIESNDRFEMTIRCMKSQFVVPGQDGSEFPELTEVESEKGFVISQGIFKDMIRQTIFSIASEDSSRPILSGELLDVKNGMMNMVAVDGFRISLRKTEINTEDHFSVVVPGKTLNEIMKILESEEDAMMQVRFNDKYILFSMGQVTVVSRLLEGAFLDYERNLSMTSKTMVHVDRKDLMNAIDRAALISRESKNSPVRLEISDQNIIITSNTERGSAYEEVPVTIDGEGLTIAFNPRYLLEALRSIDDDQVDLAMASSLNPCMIQSADQGQDLYKYFILPIRLR